MPIEPIEGRTWLGKGIKLEKEAGGKLKLCLMPDEPGAESRCFSSDTVTDEDAEVLAFLLSELGAVDFPEDDAEPLGEEADGSRNAL